MKSQERAADFNRDECMSADVKILHLYHDLMNLFGDWANPRVLARELEARGVAAAIHKRSVDEEIDFDEYDFVFIGCGTERSQRACMRDLAWHGDALFARIEEGLHVLVTGNANELFGRGVTTADGERYEALGLFGFESVQSDSRIARDCLYSADFMADKVVGVINRAGDGQLGAIERPFSVEYGLSSGENSRSEGFRYKNLLGTYLIGPLLARNPPLTKFLADSLCGPTEQPRPTDDLFFKHQQEAYRLVVKELSERVGE